MFSKKPLLGTSLGQEVPSVCICLLNYSSILQVQRDLDPTREGHKKRLDVRRATPATGSRQRLMRLATPAYG